MARQRGTSKSHRGVPKGLKLDPAFTSIVTLERISGNEVADQRTSDIINSAQLIANFLKAAVNYLHSKIQCVGRTFPEAVLRLNNIQWAILNTMQISNTTFAAIARNHKRHM